MFKCSSEGVVEGCSAVYNDCAITVEGDENISVLATFNWNREEQEQMD